MDGYITIGTELDTKSFDAQIKSLETKLNAMEKDYNRALGAGVKPTDAPLVELAKKIEIAKNKIIQLRTQKEKLEQTGGLQNLGKSFEGLVKKAGKLALGVFGIRTAYMALRRASADLATYDPQYAANLEYIRFVLTQAIAPVLQWIVKMAGTLLAYINSIMQSIFGINLFSRGSVDAFKKMKTNAGGVSKAVKEIKKTLAGFDEANILTQNKDTGGAGGGGGYVAPNIDISSGLSGELPKIEDIMDKVKSVVFKVIDSIKENFAKVMLDLGFSNEFVAYWKDMVEDIKTVFDGLITAVGGILQIIVGLFSGDTEKVKQGVKNLVLGIITILGGLMNYTVDMLKNMLQGIYDFLLKPVIEAFKKTWNNVLSFIDERFIKPTKALFSVLWNILVSGIETAKNKIKTKFEQIRTSISTIIDKIKNKFKEMGTKVGDAVGNAFKTVVNAILSKIETQLNRPINAINALISKINSIPGINMGTLSRISLPRLAVGGIVNMPNKGTMIGGALAGESGAEGVIPLTDSQAMETLGEAIGRYITINANIVNKMNGRVLSKELIRVQNEQDFAFNA